MTELYTVVSCCCELQVLLPEQQLLESPEQWAGILAHIPDSSLRDKLHRSWSNNGKGRDAQDLNVARWNELVHELTSMKQVWLPPTCACNV